MFEQEFEGKKKKKEEGKGCLREQRQVLSGICVKLAETAGARWREQHARVSLLLISNRKRKKAETPAIFGPKMGIKTAGGAAAEVPNTVQGSVETVEGRRFSEAFRNVKNGSAPSEEHA